NLILPFFRLLFYMLPFGPLSPVHLLSCIIFFMKLIFKQASIGMSEFISSVGKVCSCMGRCYFFYGQSHLLCYLIGQMQKAWTSVDYSSFVLLPLPYCYLLIINSLFLTILS